MNQELEIQKVDGGAVAVARARYRPEIDGLRAIAVLAVIAYHIGFWWVPGGFVGVDVFFVISGYLISAIIQKEISAGVFSLTGFYARRICRILPAFIVMAVVTSLFAYHYFFPPDLTSYGRSLIAAALSIANFYFWSVAGYFDTSSATQPLIHTWSLAVEEQFYVFLPLLLLLAHKYFPTRRQLSIYLVLAFSFVLSIFLVLTHPSATFFFISTRAWELLIGTILSFPGLSLALRRIPREAVAGTGVSLILAAVFGFSSTTVFPGATALLPCLGAALIIAAADQGRTRIGDVLAMRPFVFLGKISYSLYLWHWPIVVFQHEYAILIPNQSMAATGHNFLLRNLAILGASLTMAILSWRFVEQPFRKGYETGSKRHILLFGVGISCLLATAGGVILIERGFPQRFSPEAIRLASYLNYGQGGFREGQCFILAPGSATSFDKSRCLEQHPGRKSYLLIGDSTAADLWYGFSHTWPELDILQATGAGCKPLFSQSLNAYAECSKVIDFTLKSFLKDHKVDAVVISARWPKSDLPRLGTTIETLRSRGIRVVVIGPRMAYTSSLPRLLAMAVEQHDPRLPNRELVPRAVALDDQVEQTAIKAGASFISMYKMFCPQSTCQMIAQGDIPLQFDDVHFTREGSIVAAELIKSTGFLP